MKHITKSIISAVLLFFVLLTMGCPQAGKLSGTKNSGTAPAVPQNPYELVEADVLTAFGLTKGTQSPFEAANKIASGTSNNSSIVFMQKEVTAYDDEAGTFTVKVRGAKNGKEFEKEMNFSGFANPYNAQPWIINLSDNKVELKLDEGIEGNLSIEKYAEKANANIAAFFKAPLTFSFEKNNGISVKLGDFPQYKLIATLAKEGTDKVKIVPVYTVKNHKKTAGGSDTVTTKEYSDFYHLTSPLTKNYFTEEDVFKYVLNKTVDEDAIKVVADEFASAIYAFAKETKKAPSDLFSEEFKAKVQVYTNLYQTQDADEHCALDIDYSVYNPSNGGIDANDYTGTLTAAICIATKDQIADQNGITAFKKVTKSGFASIPDDAALATNTHLFFNLMASSPSTLTQTDKTKWEKKTFDKHPLFSVDVDGTYTNKENRIKINNPFKSEMNPFLLSVNDSQRDVSTRLGCGHNGASKTVHENEILIKSIVLNKTAGSKSMDIYVTLHGGSSKELKVTVTPYY
ncbi:lipoprotein 17-related variable surface protein [Treponema denticola]|uniref:lipoprotein 17-related variable surface protein n=1 Tax=Treponema denticola TaxID=158 RepID=UPI0020A503CD|nr:lipoprotein 17-related variable surface protein [Treponema denticola]UTC83345.1 hypothetical protein HGJ18_09015 [Treponema denticola]